MDGWIYFLLIIAIAAAWMLLDPDTQQQRYFEKLLVERDPVDDVTLHRRYFDSKMAFDIPGRVRRVLATHMDYPAEEMLPDDDLMFYWRELDLTYVFQDLERDFKIRIDHTDLKHRACTVRGFSELVNDLTKKGGHDV